MTYWNFRTAVVASALASMSAATSAAAGQQPMRFAWLAGPTWYAIAGSYPTKAEANRKARQLGEPWIVQNSNICTNFTPRLWIVVHGGNSQAEVQSWARRAGGYVKECL